MEERDQVAEEVKEDRDAPTERKRLALSANLVFERHYYDYQLALREIQNDSMRCVNELQERCSRELQRVQVDANRAAQEAYDKYSAAYRRGQSQAEETSESDAQQPHRDYVKVYEEGQQATGKVSADIGRTYQREIERIQEEVRQAWEDAFRDYIQSVRGSWMEIDPQTVSGAALAAIAQTMIAAATSQQSAERVGEGVRPHEREV